MFCSKHPASCISQRLLLSAMFCSGFNRLNNILFVQSAAIPYLSHEVLGLLGLGAQSTPPAYAVSVDTTYHMLRAVQAANADADNKRGSGLAAFASLKPIVGNAAAALETLASAQPPLTCLTLKSAGDLCPGGHHEQDVVPIWTRYGKRTMSSDEYMRYVDAYEPDMFVTLCDGDTNADSSRKRALKSADRSERFFDECLTKFRTSEVLRRKSTMLLGEWDSEEHIERP